MFDGNGNWTSDFSAQADRDNGIKILASRFDNIFIADIKESFENCLTKDGQIAPIGNFNMGGQKITNLNNGVNDNDAVNMSQLNNAVSSLLSSLYPIGSIYIGTQSTCPLTTLISGSNWEKVATSLVTEVSIPSTIAVYGNGKTLGLNDGSLNVGLFTAANTTYGVEAETSCFNVSKGTIASGGSWLNSEKGLGVTTSTNGSSGLIAKSDSITRAKLTVNVWRRIS